MFSENHYRRVREENARAEREGQLGAVVVFRPGVTREQVAAAWQLLANIIEGEPQVAAFNPEHGHPVFYVP